MNYRLFVDEVGNGDLRAAATDPNARYLSLTGYLTRQSTHDGVIQPRLDEIKTELFGHTPENPVILHRRELVRRQGPFECLNDPERLERFNSWLLEFIDEMPSLVFTVQIDKRAHVQRYNVWRHDPYHYCMQCLMERYVQWLEWHGFRGDVFIEARGREPDRKLQDSYQRLYDRGTKFVTGTTFQRVLRTKKAQMKTKSANVAGLQMADLLAHPAARHMRHVAEQREPTNDFGASIVEILLRRRFYRNRRTLQIEGTGLKWLP